jgi:hypothetical protein
MKRILLSIFTAMLFLPAIAQERSNPNFEAAMQKALKGMFSNNAAEAEKGEAAMDRIAEVESKNWLPLYYSSLSKVTRSFNLKGPENIDPLIDDAEALLARASELSPNNSEIEVVKSMAHSARLMADPMGRGMKYGQLSAEAVNYAIELNSGNPRAYYIKAQSLFYTPENFGGGKKAALETAKNAKSMFEKFKPASPLHPSWGLEQIDALIKQCETK